jgi:signal transduction histidine kinase/ActR/RegA family two-component response regulator
MTVPDVMVDPSRVLVLAPTGRDAAVTAEILGRARFQCTVCQNAEELCAALDSGAGLALITAEALSAAAMAQIARTLAAQPAWSDIPLMIMVAGPEIERGSRSFEPLGPRAHVTLVDRPIHVRTLVSAARAALRSRLRQYEIRDLLHELEERVRERDRLLSSERAHAERLSGLAQASLAIASALSLDDVLQLITNEARKVINAAVAVTSIGVLENGQTRDIRSVACPECDSDLKARLLEAAAKVLEGLAHDLQRPVRFTDPMLHDHPLRTLFDERLHGSMIAPLLERNGDTVGVIALAGKSDGGFTDDDEAVLTQLAQMASAAIQNARLYREAQEANRAKDDFLATLAHELRTPMTGILGWVEMLKMADADENDVKTAIQMIESSTRVQARLVEDLLDVSRVIAGKLRIELGAVELGPVVETVAETFRGRAEERGVMLHATIEALPLSVYGDETRLYQVIWNLLSNAIKFTPSGGQVHLELLGAEGRAIIRVTDSGQGIDPAFLPHVFERFRQADTTTTRQQAGLGLGLAIVRHLVELHAGTVTAESDGLDRGATFTVTLPVLAVRTSETEEEKSRQESAPALNGVNILVVDDDRQAGQLVSNVLAQFGATARAVTSVGEAVKALRHFPADVIVSDIAMPGEDGYALMRRLREIQPQLGRDIPAMALTAYGRPEDRVRILSSGFQKYVQKPVEPVELAHAIATLIEP